MAKNLEPRKIYFVLPENMLDCRAQKGSHDVYCTQEIDRARRHRDLSNSERERESEPMYLMFAADIANLEHVTD